MTSNLDRQVATLAADPADERAFQALEEAYFQTAEWEKLVALYRHRLDDPSLEGPQQRAPLHYRLGQILEERCLEIDQAINQYTKAIQADPSCRSALRQLRQAHAAREAWDLVLQISEVEIATLREPYERAAFFAEMGLVWLRHIHDTQEAMSCFEQALAIDPEQKEALAGLARVLEARGQPEAAAATWERLIGCVRGPDRAAPLVALASLLAGPLHQTERAVELYRRALGDDPRNEGAVEALAVSAGARGQWELLSDLFERRFRLANGARRRTAIALEAGHMHLEQLENAETARIWFERARELSGDDVTVLSAFVDLERLAGTDETLIDALERTIEVGGRDTPVRLLLEAANRLTERADDEQALHYLEMAQAKGPDNPLVLDALAATHRNLLQYEELASVLERRACLAETDPDRAAPSLVELGDVQADQLNDPEAAADAYERAFAIRPGMPGVASRLETLHHKSESWGPLRELLERAREHGPEGERAGFHCSLGELLEKHFDESLESAKCYEACLDLGPNPSALQGLSRLASRSEDPDAVIRALEREADMNLEPGRLGEICLELCQRYEDRGQLETALPWVERAVRTAPEDPDFLKMLASVQERLGREDDLGQTLGRLELAVQGLEQSAVRRRIARLHEKRGDAETAIGCWESALELEPEHLESLRALRRHYQELGRAEDLVPILRKLGDLAPGDEQAGFLEELCTLLDEQLCDLDGAIVVMWRLMEAPGRPENVGARLESLLERAGRFEELAQQLLERRRALPEDSDEAVEIDLRRAQLLLDPLGQFEEAVASFRAVHMRAPDRREATIGLERALRAANDSTGLVRLLLELAEQSDDADERERLHFERAVLLEESLGELEQARQAYAALCQADTSPAMATQAGTRLESLLERCGDWDSLRTRLEAAIHRCGPREQLELHERLASLCADRMDDQEGCAEHLEAGGRLDPQRPDSWRKLATLYKQLDRPDDLLRVTLAELETGPDPERERVLHARAASLWMKRPGDEERACDHYERLLELEPGRSDATEFLVARYEAESRHADVARLLEGRLAAVSAKPRSVGDDPNRSLQHSLRLRIASLRSEQLNDPEAAIELLEPAYADMGPTGPATEPLADLYQQTRRHGDLIELCEQAAQASISPAERTLWLLRLAECLRKEGEDAGAAAAYREVLDERPDDPDAFSALCDLYRQGDKPGALADLLDASLSRIAGVDEIAVRMELAKLLEQELGRPLDALAHLQRIIELEGDHDAAFRHALHLAGQLERHDDQLQLIDARLELDRPTDRADLLERRANLLAGALSSPESAVSTLREVIALDPHRRSARASLREALERLGRWTAVLDCLYMDADGADPEERAQIYEHAVEVATAQVGPDAALPWLERLRALRPGDPLIVARIADVHRLAGRFESVLRALEDELVLTTDLEHKRDLHVGRARILERDMRAPGRAISALEEARGFAPEDAEILAKLDALYDLTGRAKERAEVIEARIELETGQSLQLHLAAAELYSESLADPGAAIPHLLRAVFLTRSLVGGVGEDAVATPEARVALLADLASTLRAAGREEGWARAAEAELTVLLADLDARPPESDGDPRHARRAEIHRDLSWLYAENLASPTAALRHMRTVLELAGPDAECPGLTREELDRLESAYLDLLRQDSNWVELERGLAARLARGAGDADGWLELGRLRDERLHAPQAALDAYSETLTHRPSSLPAIRGLRDLAERLGSWPEVVRSLELELALPDRWSPHEQAARYRRLGEVCWRRMDAVERATVAYAAALEASPGDLESLRSLEELREVQGHWGEAIDLYEREAEILGDDDPERRKAVWLVAANLAANRTGDPRRALHAYEAAAKLSGLRPEHLRVQADLYQQVGETDRFAETFAQWLDDPGAGATASEHLALAGTLVELGRQDHALDRARRAVDADEHDPQAWATVAQLHQDRGHPGDAADAWERAAELRAEPEAADHLIEAARLVESSDLELCARRLRRAVEMDAGSASAHAHLARVALDLEHYEEAESAAARALDLASAGSGSAVDDSLRLETALVGGRAARALDRLEAAALFFGVALDFDDRHEGALEAYGELLFERGDLAAARGALEARLAGGPDERRAERLAMLASVLELEGEADRALELFREAIVAEPGCGAGHAGVARLCEKAGRIDEAIDALEGWAATAREAGERAGWAARLIHAAELEIARDDAEAAETHLRRALQATPENPRTWVMLAEILADADRVDEILRLAPQALAQDSVSAAPDAFSRLSLLHGRALERRDEAAAACGAYADAVGADSRCAEAALAGARLLRTRGDWNEAAEALRRFCDEHPEPDHRDLAEAHYKLARLLSGPLEDMDGAIQCFARVLEIAPDHPKARERLASLLAVMPDRWNEAIVHHAALLENEPTRSDSVRALCRIAKARGQDGPARFGLAVLRAIGAASPEERSEAPDFLPRAIVAAPALEEPIGEIARRLVQHASETLDQVLEDRPDEGVGALASAGFQIRMRAAEREVAAAGLDPFSEDELGDLVYVLAALSLGDEAGGSRAGQHLDPSFVEAVDQALGRWTRRKIRRSLDGTSLEQLQAIDFGAWRVGVLGLAAAVAVDAGQGDLRGALVGLCLEGGEAAAPAETEDWTARIQGQPVARELLRRVAAGWCTELVRG